MKLTRLVCLLVPVATLVACSSAPVDAPSEKADSTHEDLTVVWNQCRYATCEVDPIFTSTPANLVAMGCSAQSTVATYQTETGDPYSPINPPSVSSPITGWFTQCPISAESTLTPACNYCLEGPTVGYFWYEWLSEEVRPCTSGCLRNYGPPPSYP